MKFSQAFIKTDKNQTVNNSFDLVTKAGLVHQYAAGSYGYMPLGQRVLDNITSICVEKLTDKGALKVSAPLVQSAELWGRSGRWDIYGNLMLKMQNRDGQEFCVAPTHEEALTDMVSSVIHSQKDLPITLFQIGTKYRDEKRPRHGLLRTREFLMLDAYSFDVDQPGSVASYGLMREAFEEIFKKIGLEVVISSADSGEVGGEFSEEFLAPATYGEDEIAVDGRISKGIEVGHIFQLGTRYSEPMGLTVDLVGEGRIPVLMGCYGIGISRLIPAIIDQHNDKRGIIWPSSVAPYQVEIILVGDDSRTVEVSEKLESQLEGLGITTLVDDRNVSAGVKFNDAGLIGIPYSVIIGRNFLESGQVEIENRKTNNRIEIDTDKVVEIIQQI